MALIFCGGCGRQISDRALRCPHCGNNYAPINKTLALILSITGICVAALGFFFYRSSLELWQFNFVYNDSYFICASAFILIGIGLLIGSAIIVKPRYSITAYCLIALGALILISVIIMFFNCGGVYSAEEIAMREFYRQLQQLGEQYGY